ncbi:hypothetical protein JHW43_004962 [Diplocarpon mali]|nr:hypothetical protein JHW43_004962 [Diplocarpon mali]
MVLTRTQDGTIDTKTYSPLALGFNSISLPGPPSSATAPRNGPGSPRASRGARQIPLSVHEQKLLNAAASHSNAAISIGPAPPRISRARAGTPPAPGPLTPAPEEEVDLLGGNPFFPSIVIGAKEAAGLSKIGRADKEVEMWEAVLAQHEQGMPSLVPVVRGKLEEAKQKRAGLDEADGANGRVGDVDPAASDIQARIVVLEGALATSQFGPEAENIKCAIAAYQSGEIGHSDHLTVIYAAHVVDTVATYGEFVRRRTEMLDRYSQVHGPGWMWYEPPLKVHPEARPRLQPSVALQREDDWTALGGWYVTQGFWKRAGYVARMQQTQFHGPSLAASNFQPHPSDPALRDCQGEGPRLCFRSMLDSGATYPTLHSEDLASLDIDARLYSAQSVTTLQTAAGDVSTRVFELFVCVLDDDGRQLVDADDPVYPLSHQYLGGLCPVAECSVPLAWDSHGMEISSRLSGILPFAACYVSSTPSRNTLYLGEDRNDVLGSHRMPGQKKWSIEMAPIAPGLSPDRYDNPAVRFSHRGGLIVDEDDVTRTHVSKITFVVGRGCEDHVVVSDPRAAQWALRSQQILSAPRTAAQERARGVDDLLGHIADRAATAGPDTFGVPQSGAETGREGERGFMHVLFINYYPLTHCLSTPVQSSGNYPPRLLPPSRPSPPQASDLGIIHHVYTQSTTGAGQSSPEFRLSMSLAV